MNIFNPAGGPNLFKLFQDETVERGVFVPRSDSHQESGIDRPRDQIGHPDQSPGQFRVERLTRGGEEEPPAQRKYRHDKEDIRDDKLKEKAAAENRPAD